MESKDIDELVEESKTSSKTTGYYVFEITNMNETPSEGSPEGEEGQGGKGGKSKNNQKPQPANADNGGGSENNMEPIPDDELE